MPTHHGLTCAGTFNGLLRSNTTMPCDRCPEGYTTSQTGCLSASDCNVCLPGYGDTTGSSSSTAAQSVVGRVGRMDPLAVTAQTIRALSALRALASSLNTWQKTSTTCRAQSAVRVLTRLLTASLTLLSCSTTHVGFLTVRCSTWLEADAQWPVMNADVCLFKWCPTEWGPQCRMPPACLLTLQAYIPARS
jgi:hypothetical protein